MTPWRTEGASAGGYLSRRFRLVGAALLIFGALLSFLLSPISLPLFIIYVIIGLVAGILANLGDLTAPIALFILIFGVEAISIALSRIGPEWRSAWWQPAVIAVAASVAIGFSPLFRGKPGGESGLNH